MEEATNQTGTGRESLAVEILKVTGCALRPGLEEPEEIRELRRDTALYLRRAIRSAEAGLPPEPYTVAELDGARQKARDLEKEVQGIRKQLAEAESFNEFYRELDEARDTRKAHAELLEKQLAVKEEDRKRAHADFERVERLYAEATAQLERIQQGQQTLTIPADAFATTDLDEDA